MYLTRYITFVFCFISSSFEKLRLPVCCIILFFLSSTIHLYADGSRELSLNGGNRAYLFSSVAGNQSFPFPTLGTMKVYAKAGETINVGSSAQGFGNGTINLRAPGGSTYTSGGSTNAGVITNRSQELAGPLPNAGGYTPFTVTVQTGQEGVWEVDFISQSDNSNSNPPPIPAAAEWAQPPGQYIAAFDVSVRDAANSHFIAGRVFTNEFLGILGTFNVGFNGLFYILTKDGYQYTLDNNGQAGNGFTFFANNKGFRGSNGAPSYQSIDDISAPNMQDPRIADSESDITHKIFFSPPAADLPQVANTPGGGTTWLLNTPGASAVNDMSFVGAEGAPGKAGTTPLGGNFTFNTTGGGTYQIVIDVNRNGLFTDPIDRKLTGTVNTGANTIHWDGLNGSGNKVPADTVAGYKANITVATTAGEVHFPFFDVERNYNGIILTRLNGTNTPDNIVYWDDTPITPIGTPSNPLKNLAGIHSLTNGHKWGSATDNPLNDADFGNNKGIDTWAYISSAPAVSVVSFKLYEADLEVSNIKSNSDCTGQPITYQITIKNNGPDDVTGARFRFDFSSDITNIVVNSITVTGISSASAGTVSANAYDAVVNMANGSARTFTITGKVALTSIGNLTASASIMRPADVTDPDATNPDAAPPTDPADECNASGITCNNIKTHQTTFITSPDAGDDKTVYQYAPATIAATGAGTWSQASGDPALANIGNPAAPSVNITGLNKPGTYHFINTNAAGCADTVALTVIAANLVIPNIFTPNNDGKNDVFEIKGLESYPGSQLIIFNRWGNEVYRADNYLNNWNGSNLAEGTYYYVLNRREHDGSIVPFKGWVFLKRNK